MKGGHRVSGGPFSWEWWASNPPDCSGAAPTNSASPPGVAQPPKQPGRVAADINLGRGLTPRYPPISLIRTWLSRVIFSGAWGCVGLVVFAGGGILAALLGERHALGTARNGDAGQAPGLVDGLLQVVEKVQLLLLHVGRRLAG
jgi:hypothetical protein